MRQVSTVLGVSYEQRVRQERVRQLLVEAELGALAAERAVRDAAELAAELLPAPTDGFEYRAATRALRAARTALRSALLDLDSLG